MTERPYHLTDGVGMKPWKMTIKRLLDIVISGLALILLSPVLVLIALVIRFSSPGPALFRQLRLGIEGIPFVCNKFRTMFMNASDIRNPDGSTYSAPGDQRVTKIGCFLRQTSLDEFPQLFNVLKGDMSLVGPRPDQVDQLNYYTMEEKRKLLVRPGITGLAQINGRNNIPWKRRKQFDLEYVERQSLWLDLRILAKTIPYVLLRREISPETISDRNYE